MTKKNAKISVDSEIHEKAKKVGLNVSRIAENGLRLALSRLVGVANEVDEPTFPTFDTDGGEQI